MLVPMGSSEKSEEMLVLNSSLLRQCSKNISTKLPYGNLVEIFFEHWRNKEEFKTNISSDFSDEPIGTNMDIDVLYDMFKKGASFEELIQKGNTVPEQYCLFE